MLGLECPISSLSVLMSQPACRQVVAKVWRNICGFTSCAPPSQDSHECSFCSNEALPVYCCMIRTTHHCRMCFSGTAFGVEPKALAELVILAWNFLFWVLVPQPRFSPFQWQYAEHRGVYGLPYARGQYRPTASRIPR